MFFTILTVTCDRGNVARECPKIPKYLFVDFTNVIEFENADFCETKEKFNFNVFGTVSYCFG